LLTGCALPPFFPGAGALGVAFSPTLSTVLAGRLIFGLGIGFAMHAAPAYIAETSPPQVRGLFISLKECFIVGGILAGYLVSYLAVDVVGGWRWMYGSAAPMAIVLAVGMVRKFIAQLHQNINVLALCRCI